MHRCVRSSSHRRARCVPRSMLFRLPWLGRAIIRSSKLEPPWPRTFSTLTGPRAMASEYKIKGLSSLDLKSGEKREVELEGIENGKLLLAKVGDKTHALSPNCTHYGAPLKLGVLTPDGRLTCAWHGGESGLVLHRQAS